MSLRDDYNELLKEYNGLLAQYHWLMNKVQTNTYYSLVQTNTQQFTKTEISSLIQLCHPDKHDGKKSAVEITQRLIKIRESLK